MKKNYLLAMLAAGLLASCSSGFEENLEGTSPVTPGNTDANDNELMEIRLGNGGLMKAAVSRAALTPDTWVGTTVGIFALNKLDDPVTHAKPVWDDGDVTTTDLRDCLLKNVSGEIIAQSSTNDPDKQGISFGANKYYYPRASSKAYSFYGYYPRKETLAPDIWEFGTDHISCQYTMSGVDDIIWGKAFVADAATVDGKTYDGYNAAYFRKVLPTPANPTIEFKHLLTQLKFYLKKGDEYTAEKCGVTAIKVVSVPKNGSLMIASQIAENPEGKMIWKETVEAADGSLSLNENPVAANITDVSAYSGASITLGADETNAKEVENSTIMLPAGFKTLKLASTLQDGDKTTTTNATISPDIADGTFFKEGFAYKVILTINGPKEIQVDATLKAWETGKDIGVEI